MNATVDWIGLCVESWSTDDEAGLNWPEDELMQRLGNPGIGHSTHQSTASFVPVSEGNNQSLPISADWS